jgi:hypothetical protein
MTQFTHYGLFFTEAHLQRAQKSRDKAPFAKAFDSLESQHPDPLAEMLLNGYRYRLGNSSAGEKAREALSIWLTESPPRDFLIDMREAVLTAQTIELIRPLLNDTHLIEDWIADTIRMLETSPDEMHLQLWKGVVMLAYDIVSDTPIHQNAVIALYQQAIDEWLHPEGYIPKIVDHHNEVVSFTYQLQATQGLALMAEMAKHIGIDLYSYNKRGVSVTTACAYPLYYYFYPEKWRWNGDKYRPSEGVPEDTAKLLFRDHAGFLEIIAEHYKPPLKAIQMILDDLRPLLDPFGGGLTTLTHAPAPRKGLFG